MNAHANIRLLSLCLMLILSIEALAQSCDNWVYDLKSAGNDEMSVVYADSNGVVVTAGRMLSATGSLVTGNNDTAPLLDTSTISASTSATLVVSLKEAQTASVNRWVKAFDCTGSFFVGDIHHRNGVTYVNGFFTGTFTFGAFNLTSVGQRDAFLVKLDANGDVMWALSEGGTGFEQMRGIAVDDYNIYISGYYMNGSDFGGTILTSQNNTSLFVASYEIVTGSLNWIKTIDGTNGKDEATKIVLTTDGSLYIGAFTSGGALVNASPLVSVGGRDAAVVKMDTLGNFDWVTTFGGVNNEGVNDLVYDPVNDLVYIAGIWESSGVTVQGNTVPVYGSSDGFVGCLNTSGTLLWVTTMGSSGVDSYDILDVTGAGNIVVAGYTNGDIVSGTETAVAIGGQSVVYSVLDVNGNVLQLEQLGGSGDDNSTDIFVGKSTFNDNSVFITGFYEGQAQFGAAQFEAVAGQDGFLWSKCLTGLSQNCNEWHYELSGTGNDQSTVVYESEAGFTVLGGTFAGANVPSTLSNVTVAPFSDQENLLNGTTTQAIYVTLKDSIAGSDHLWSAVFPGTGFVYLDEVLLSNGSVYAVGYFDGSLTIGANTLICPGSVDGFVAKLDANNGAVDWVKHLTGSGWERILEVVADDDNVYVVGYNENGATFGDSSLTSLFNNDGFVASLEQSTGTFNWISDIHGASGKVTYNGLAIDGAGNLYASGIGSGVINYNTGSVTANSVQDGFIQKMDTTTGTVQWFELFGGSALDGAQDIAYDPVNDLVYLAGVYSSTDMSPFGTNLPVVGGQDAFVCAYNPSGVMQWILPVGSAATDDFRDVTALSTGELAVTGWGAGNAYLANDTLVPDNSNTALYYLRVNSIGVVQESEYITGTTGDVYGYGISSYTNDNNELSITIAGYYTGQMSLGGKSYNAAGGDDGFAWEFCAGAYQAPVTSEVWPGDADNNGIANNWDILPFGLIYGDQGPVRPSASNVWVGQPAADWGTQFVNGSDYKHVDCDGNGQVDLLDIVPILLNYGQTHPKRIEEQRLAGPRLFVDLVQDSVIAGDTAEFNIELGLPSNLAQNIYGLAFTINFDPELVVQGSVNSFYNNSWLGNLGTDMEKLDIELHQQGKFDVGVTRVDKAAMTGAGEIVRVSVITIDNISGKDLLDLTMPIWISDVKMIDNNGTELAVELGGDTLTIVDVEVGVSTAQAEAFNISIYPNPANDELTVNSSQQIDRVTAYNAIGQVVIMKDNVGERSYKLDTQVLEQGLHFIEVQTTNGVIRERLMINR